MNFIHQIYEQESCVPSILEELKTQSLPLVFYGSGLTAAYWYDFFSKSGLRVNHFAVDKEYFTENKFFVGQPVEIIEDVLDNYKSVNIFVGFCTNRIDLIQKYLYSTTKVNKVYSLDDPPVFNNHLELYTYDYVLSNLKQYQWLYEQLGDDLSRLTMCGFINQRISQKLGYLDNIWGDDAYNPKLLFEYGQNEVFVDCGAYDGDSIIKFVENIALVGGNYSQLIAFEPDPSNFSKLQQLQYSVQNLLCINKGVWSKKSTLNFNNTGTASSSISDCGGVSVNVESIDDVLRGERCSYIKMDVEGSELSALIGARETIVKHKPKLAICVYHKKDDLLTIPQYIKFLVPEYKLYLRVHRAFTKELVLYASI